MDAEATKELTREEVCQLSTWERQEYVEKLRITYPAWKEILQKIERCHRMNKISAEPQTLLIVGRPRAGKTTVMASYHEQYPSIRVKQEGGGYITYCPVVRAEVPSKATEINLIREIGNGLGDPLVATAKNQGEMTDRLMKLFEKCRVEMLMLDEIQHFVDRDNWKVLMSASNWLKAFIKKTKIACILAGLEGEAEQVINANPQLKSLFGKPKKLGQFDWYRGQPDGAFKYDPNQNSTGYRSLLNTIQMLLPLREDSNLVSPEIAWRCYVASGGLMGYQMELLRTATHFALEQGYEALDIKLLALAYTERLESVREIPNPFDGEMPEFVPLPTTAPHVVAPKKNFG
jgi:hypothetical protein